MCASTHYCEKRGVRNNDLASCHYPCKLYSLETNKISGSRRKIQLLAEHPCHPVPGEEIDNRHGPHKLAR
ncbi:hypothetical protein OOU_Y34scaffold00370g11 [Pyricularia oryzae Y34]|uniref:Uncharacterized protein n=2 Tax=Pyricularia oryzae TaxID=318829 RepID=A0AA97PN46_PYRO3|nr:hypothetical protein OOU_Y34scaffold00370g11 [Pyricularia oryzae Y34]